MKATGLRIWLLVLAVFFGTLPAAVSGPGPAARQPAAAGTARLALAPLNLAQDHGLDLLEAERIVQAELVRYLGEAGVRVGVIHPADAERAWQVSLAEQSAVGEPTERLDMAAGGLAMRLRRDGDFEFDYLVLPSLAFREARVRGRFARWDGVRRRVSARRARGASQAHYFREWEGRITGLSLHVRVYRSDGRPVHMGWGGLDLTHDPVVVGSAMAQEPIPQASFLAETDHVREGVTLALGDFLRSARR